MTHVAPASPDPSGVLKRLGLAETDLDPVMRRIIARSTPDGDCIVWTGLTFPGKPYGRISYSEGGRTVFRRVHREAYQRLRGAVPAGAVVDHMCHNQACWNPRHLQAVPPKLNSENRDPERNPTRGVSWRPRARKWIVRVKHDGVSHYGGYFDRKEDALAAARELRLRLHVNNLADRAAA